METLSKYYTKQNFSRLLVSFIRHENPCHVLDLGAGDGSLLKAAYERWGNAAFYAVDIDIHSSRNIKNKLPFANFYQIDGLRENISKNTKLKIGSIDIAVCNPPYKILERDIKTNQTLYDAKLLNTAKLPLLTSDIVFLAQNLLMLKDGGELGIILPDGLFSGERYRAVREDILNRHKILGIIELPDGIFNKTEAKTHILLLEKGGTTSPIIPLYKSNRNGEIEDTLNVDSNDLLYRMDYSYNIWRHQNINDVNKQTLRSINAEIKRGKRSKKELEKLEIQYFHTKSFSKNNNIINFKKQNSLINDTVAKPGDILIARVGKRCLGRVAIVHAGYQVISDCVFRLRVRKEFRQEIFDALNSDFGQNWLKAHSHGVCSKFISKSDLLNFPIK
jgi:type I restriction enzyme M protein